MPMKYELLELTKEGKAVVEVPLDDEDRAALITLLRKKHAISDTIKVLEQQKESIGMDLATFHAQWEESVTGFLAGQPYESIAFYLRDVLESDEKPDATLQRVQSKAADSISPERLLELGVPLSTIQAATVPGKLHNPYIQDYPQKPGKVGGE